jgi:hypothetical protein
MRLLLCRNTTYSKDNVAAATLVSRAEYHLRPEKCDWLALVSKTLAEQP